MAFFKPVIKMVWESLIYSTLPYLKISNTLCSSQYGEVMSVGSCAQC